MIIFLMHKALFFRSYGNVSAYINTLAILIENNYISSTTRT